MRSSSFAPSPSRPRHRRAGAEDTSSRRLPLQMDEKTAGWATKKSGRFSFLTLLLEQQRRLGSKARPPNDEERNFSVRLPLSSSLFLLLSPSFSSRSLRSPISPRLQLRGLDSLDKGDRQLKSRQGRERRLQEAKPNLAASLSLALLLARHASSASLGFSLTSPLSFSSLSLSLSLFQKKKKKNSSTSTSPRAAPGTSASSGATRSRKTW